jgi:hypothetical protein
MTRVPVLALTLVIAVPWSSTPAQPLAEVAPGARVRIQAPGIVAGRYAGTVLARTPDTLVVASAAAGAVRVPIASLTSVEVSRGRSRSLGAMKGAAWGAGIGLAIGLVTAGVADDQGYGSGGEYVVFNALGGAVWGAIIGAIAGSERWDRYDLSRRTSLVLPRPGHSPGLGLRVAIER